MTDPAQATDPGADPGAAQLRLAAALDGLAVALRGATARPDESNCTCHWGSAEELALLKVPDVELEPDLLRRSWQAPDWRDHASVLRRILPQLAATLLDGRAQSFLCLQEIGASLGRARWPQWPAQQSAAVREFLHAWWAHSLVTPGSALPASETFVLCAEASGELGSWLDVWEALDHPEADRSLAEAVDAWEYALLLDDLPWSTWHSESKEELRLALTDWLTRHAPARLKAHGASEQLLHRVRLFGLTGANRWDDPHWPGHTY